MENEIIKVLISRDKRVSFSHTLAINKLISYMREGPWCLRLRGYWSYWLFVSLLKFQQCFTLTPTCVQMEWLLLPRDTAWNYFSVINTLALLEILMALSEGFMRLLNKTIKIICKYSPREEIYCFLTLDIKWWKWEFRTICSKK